MYLLATSTGIVLILVALYDIFRTLFLPSGKGLISKNVEHAVWRLFRKPAARWPSILTSAGGASLVASAASWGVLMVLGWALIYWPRMPDGFTYDPGMSPAENAGFLDAFYLSVVTLATLGYGDISPDQTSMRLFGPLQALVGFLLLTAIISWLLSIYPDLSRRQAFARKVSLLRDAERTNQLDFTVMNVNVADQLLAGLTAEVVAIRGDLQQFPITYYFQTSEEKSSLALVLPYVLEVAQRSGQANAPPEVRLQSARLRAAIDDLAETLATGFLGMPSEPVDQVFAAYARDHLHDR